jgi:hypothetical protein
MRFKGFTGKLVLLGLVAMSSVWLHGQAKKGAEAGSSWSFPDFSGTQVFVSNGRETPFKIFRSGTTVRIEEGVALATLYVPGRSSVYRLTKYPDGSHQCVVMKSEQAKMIPSPMEVLLSGTNIKRSPAGSESFEGHSCTIETVTLTRVDGKTIESKVWEADDLKGLPVKIEMESDFGKLRAVYRDIVVGAPDAGLFAVPDKCTPIEKMGQVVEQKTIK